MRPKVFILVLALIATLCRPVWAADMCSAIPELFSPAEAEAVSTFTALLGLEKPGHGDLNWDTAVNANSNILDDSVLHTAGVALTAGRVPYVTTGGKLTDEAALAYDAATDTLTAGALTIRAAVPTLNFMTLSDAHSWLESDNGILTYSTGRAGEQATPDRFSTGTTFSNSATPTNQQLQLSLLDASATDAFGWTLSSDAGIWAHSGDSAVPTDGYHMFATGGLPRLRIGSAGIGIYGSTSGVVSLVPQAAAGTYNFNLPTTAGNSGECLTSAGGGASPMTWTDPLTSTEIDTSAELAGIVTDETGTGALCFATAPTIDSPIFTTKIRPPSVTAFPGTPTTGDTVIVTDDSAIGACDSAAGSAVSLCRYNGSAWASLGDGGGSGDITDVWGCSSGNCNALTAAAGDTLNATGADSTAACKSGTTAPATCAVGECFFDTDATAGQNNYGCTATNTWTLEGDGGSSSGYATVQDEGSGLTQRTTLNFAGAGVSCADDTTKTTCTITGTSGGDAVSVNGTAAADADFDDATPAAAAGTVNVKWQKDAGTPNNISAYVPVMVASGASHAPGLVGDPGASAGTTKFWREDATWVVPSGGSSRTTFSSGSGSSTIDSGTATRWFAYDGISTLSSSDVSLYEHTPYAAGTFKNYICSYGANLTAGTMVFTFDSSSALTCTISSGSKTCSDTTHTVHQAGGGFDLAINQVVTSGMTPLSERTYCSVEFVYD